MGLINDHDIPSGVLQEMLIAGNILQSINTDYDTLIDLKRILVGRNPES